MSHIWMHPKWFRRASRLPNKSSWRIQKIASSPTFRSRHTFEYVMSHIWMHPKWVCRVSGLPNGSSWRVQKTVQDDTHKLLLTYQCTDATPVNASPLSVYTTLCHVTNAIEWCHANDWSRYKTYVRQNWRLRLQLVANNIFSYCSYYYNLLLSLSAVRGISMASVHVSDMIKCVCVYIYIWVCLYVHLSQQWYQMNQEYIYICLLKSHRKYLRAENYIYIYTYIYTFK